MSSDFVIIDEMRDVEWHIAECNGLIEDQRQRIEKLAYEGYDTFSEQTVFDSLCESLALHVQTRHRLHAKLNDVKVA
jgi:hypothetical protein